jgi:hypothetical protein
MVSITCPICGEYINLLGRTTDDRLIGSCGDAFPARKLCLTLSEIKRMNQDAGYHFFDRKTLKFFGETMKSYYLCKGTGDKVIIKRNRKSMAGEKYFEFDPVSCMIK